jgi:hypothetical protein
MADFPELEPESRQEVRPGLTLVRRFVRKPDGRYLLHYEFERDAGGVGAPPGAADPSPTPGTGAG